MVITEIGKDHWKAVAALYAATWRATYAGKLSPPVVEQMIEGLSRPSVGGMLPEGAVGLGAFEDQRLLGTAVFRQAGSTAYLWGMYILPEHQRQGIGSALVNEVISRLLPNTDLEVRVLKTSLHAVQFYTADGFVPTGHERTEIFENVFQDSIIMTRACLR